MHHRAFAIVCAVTACGSLLFCKVRRAGLFLALVLLAMPVVHAQIKPVCDGDCNPDTPPNSSPPSGQVPVDRGMPSNQRGLGTVFSAATQTGGAATIQGSSSYTYKVPLHSLPGRAGLDLNLTLYHNSHIWVPDATGGMLMGFDRDTPGPGFQLNFGFLEWNPSANGPSGILTTADGAKHTLSVDLNNLVPKPGPPPNNLWYECANQVCLYNSDDSSYINVSRPLGTFDGSVCQGPNNCPAKDATVTYKNGTQAIYRSFAVVTNDIFDEFVMRPYYIRDSNGNSISINYLNDNDLSISSINDSLGRTLNFFYTSVQVQMVPGQVSQTVSLLSCVTDGASCNAPGSRTYTFSWDQSHAVNFNFSQPGQMLLGGTLFNVQSGFTTPVLTTVCRPDATCVQFKYGDWGIVNDIQELSSSGTVRYELNYDFPTAAAGTLSLNPTYAHQKEIINGQTNTWTYAANTDANGLLTSSSIMDPDGLVATTTYSRKGDWADGLPIQVQMESGPLCLPPCAPPTTPPLLTRNLVWTSDLAMAQSGITNGGYPTGKNPRPASITTILDDNSQSQVTMQYDNSAVPVAAGAPQNFTGSGSVTDKIERWATTFWGFPPISR
ncbi:MAG: hypothetical protein DMG67_11860 [Acidobacteria bacterium]|nr:MAG: hypothetical protein DMG67_11860 [Acidobacteriota bacterium]